MMAYRLKGMGQSPSGGGLNIVTGGTPGQPCTITPNCPPSQVCPQFLEAGTFNAQGTCQAGLPAPVSTPAAPSSVSSASSNSAATSGAVGWAVGAVGLIAGLILLDMMGAH